MQEYQKSSHFSWSWAWQSNTHKLTYSVRIEMAVYQTHDITPHTRLVFYHYFFYIHINTECIFEFYLFIHTKWLDICDTSLYQIHQKKRLFIRWWCSWAPLQEQAPIYVPAIGCTWLLFLHEFLYQLMNFAINSVLINNKNQFH